MYNLTISQALFIKVLRIRYKCTWRAIHYRVNERYTLHKPFNSTNKVEDDIVCNQIDGMALCEASMRVLKDTVEDGWI